MIKLGWMRIGKLVLAIVWVILGVILSLLYVMIKGKFLPIGLIVRLIVILLNISLIKFDIKKLRIVFLIKMGLLPMARMFLLI